MTAEEGELSIDEILKRSLEDFPSSSKNLESDKTPEKGDELPVAVERLDTYNVPANAGNVGVYDYDAPTGSYGKKTEHLLQTDGAHMSRPKASTKLNSNPDLGLLLSPDESSSSSKTIGQSVSAEFSAPVPQFPSSSSFKTAESSTDSQKVATPQVLDEKAGGDYSPYTDVHKKLELRDYQVEVARRSLEGKNDIILLPTGAGKTYVAIKVIIEHLYKLRESEKLKVVFFVPTAELAIQQLKKIQDHLPFAWEGKTCRITGESNMPAEQLVQVVKEKEFVVLVVTPAIISNYFSMCKDASLSDFTLLIFDEYHHAKKDHPYNELIRKYLLAREAAKTDPNAPPLPQLLGMTATIGIGDAKNMDTAQDYIIGMCAKFGLESPPSESRQLSEIAQADTDEKYSKVDARRQDRLSQYLQDHLMTKLEQGVATRVKSDLFSKHKCAFKATFPEDRYNQTYEHYVVTLRDTITMFHEIEELSTDIRYCMVALNHLHTYYKTIQLVNLLNCEHGLKYLEEMRAKPEFQGVDEIWSLFSEHFPQMAKLAEEVDKAGNNPKIHVLQEKLAEMFNETPESKVIIFVQMRVVAQYMADLICKLHPTFKAKEFTSTGPSAEEGGMKPQQRFDAREGFEGEKYNILVATSVLEEGIDIKACNMVIRFMYVKDMIARIQSRGRARNKEGVILAMLDQKLLQQEQRNHYKERLMYKALAEIRDLPGDEFKRRIEAQMKTLTPKKGAQMRRQRDPKMSAKISCKVCGLHLGDVADVRKYGQSHFLVMDGDIYQRVRAFPDPSFMKPMDGMVPYGKLICKGLTKGAACGNKVGNLSKMESGLHFGMWSIKQIIVNSKPLKKYKDLQEKHNIEIQPIDFTELAELGPSCCFPVEQLEK